MINHNNVEIPGYSAFTNPGVTQRPDLRTRNHPAFYPFAQRTAFISVPGIGCGQFAGKFQGQLGTQLLNVLKTLLHEFAAKLPNVGYIYYDPYDECLPCELQFEHLRLIVRPLLHSNGVGRPQLTKPESNILPVPVEDVVFFSLVAWDHASWPGNDFYAGLRATDDGVKAAATDSMKLITGVEGTYDESVNMYTPPRGNKNWEEVVRSSELDLCSQNALIRIYN